MHLWILLIYYYIRYQGVGLQSAAPVASQAVCVRYRDALITAGLDPNYVQCVDLAKNRKLFTQHE